MEVELVDYMGSDYRILEAARVSTGAEVQKGDVKDRGLIRYLWRMEHTSPFEQCIFTWYVKCPIFVSRQLLRHRTARGNEMSSRYKQSEWEVFYPDTWRKQDTKDKQGSLDELDIDTTYRCDNLLKKTYEISKDIYKELLAYGVAREQARMVMPVGHYTEFFFNIDLHNLFHLFDVRMDSHAQKETRDIATNMYEKLKELDEFKWTMEIYDEMRAVKDEVKRLINEHKIDLWELVDKLKEV